MTHDHLEKDGDGRLKCKNCGYSVTVGPDGTEYGHKRKPNKPNDRVGTCHHRPGDKVNPDAEARGGSTVAGDRDERGRFA